MNQASACQYCHDRQWAGEVGMVLKQPEVAAIQPQMFGFFHDKDRKIRKQVSEYQNVIEFLSVHIKIEPAIV